MPKAIPTWSVGVEFNSLEPITDKFTPEELNKRVMVFSRYLPSSAVSGTPESSERGRYGAQMTIAAGTAPAALKKAITAATQAAQLAGLPPWKVATAEITEWSEFQASLREDAELR